MNGILIAGAIVAVGLLIYLLVALPGDTGPGGWPLPANAHSAFSPSSIKSVLMSAMTVCGCRNVEV